MLLVTARDVDGDVGCHSVVQTSDYAEGAGIDEKSAVEFYQS